MYQTQYKILKYLENSRSDFSDTFFETITMLGEDTLLVVIIAFIYYMFNKNLAKKIAYIVIGSLGINCAIKNIVKLPRPFIQSDISCVRPETATGYSFPSGHTQNTATWTFSFALEYKKIYLFLLSVIITLLVGFSRVYIGAHYPTDTIFGAIAGFILSFVFGYVYSKSESENKLYTITGICFTPLFIWFLINPDPLFEDFFKAYGMIWGLLAASSFESKFVSFGYDVKLYKKIMRVIIAAITALIVKLVFENAVSLFTNTTVILIFNSITYAFLVFTVMGLCPYLYKKIKF